MKKLVLVLLILFHGGLSQLQACIPVDEVDLETAQTHTLFYVTTRKIALRMSVKVIEGRPYYNFLICDEYTDFTIENADTWRTKTCSPLSKQWIPVTSPSDPEQVILHHFTEITRSDLLSKVAFFQNKDAEDPFIVSFFEILNSAVYGTVGFSLQYYAKHFTPQRKRAKVGRWMARSTGWLMIIASLLGAGFNIHEDLSAENIYHKKIERLNNIVERIDNDEYFHPESSRLEVPNILELIKDSMTKASKAITSTYCTQ